MRILIANIIAFVLLVQAAYAQPRQNDFPLPPSYQQLYPAVVHGHDTLVLYSIRPVLIMPAPKFKSRAEWRRYWRLVYNVKKVYPYAQLINYYYHESERVMSEMTEKERKQYIKRMEKYLRQRFQKELVNLTVTQGIILVKLVDRETDKTTYDIIKDFKGSFNASFWQTVARLFGNDLKQGYDPAHNKEDMWIEYIISQIEAGKL